ncbi:YibE/F family protein [Texcoconibacillus texcoconensis]|uniref:Putative membrane protein n=1 Tax=Texcoconibacillus texcoconensis TaxID=1095777 RepID=A0A840QU61_9BACI|nr:YibE/F family protein [Texcoconibacillus texcoconensis]MBB5175086.1 putative membrane protein [Texcoconibacillus texcoconensis]
MRFINRCFFIVFILFVFFIVDSQQVLGQTENSSETLLPTAQVIEIVEERYGTDQFEEIEEQYQTAHVKVLDGPYAGEVIQATSEQSIPVDQGRDQNEFWIQENDEVIVELAIYNGEVINAEIEDHTRDFPTMLLTVILVALLIVFGGIQGLKSIFTLAFTLFLIFIFMIPRLFDGYSPVYLALITGSIVAIVTFIVISGLSKKTIAATVGTIGGLVSAAVISVFFSEFMRLTGYHSVNEQNLVAISPDGSFDLKGILLAGIIIGAIGAIMDVAISIASAMEEIRKSNPRIRNGALLKSGMNVGKDIMGTMANTLILAYVGASLPLLMTLYGYESTISQVIHMEFLAVEILRTVTGSIGLILSIPITALVAAMFINTDDDNRRKRYTHSR